MPATQVQIINGSFQDSEGNKLANGYLIMELNQDETAAGAGQICGGIQVRVPLDANGNVSGTVNVWPNDQLTPANSYYQVWGYTAAGQIAWGPNAQQVIGASPFDLNTWIPNALPNFSPATSSPTLQTNGVNNRTQGKLNLVNGTNITITDDGAGDITIGSSVSVPASVSPLKRWAVIVSDGSNLNPVGILAVGPSFAAFGSGTSNVVNATATDPPVRQNILSSAGAASSYGITQFSGGATPTKWLIQKALMSTAWFRVNDATTVNATSPYIFPLALYDITVGNGSNFWSATGGDPITAAGTARGLAFWGKCNGGTAHWQASCFTAGTPTTVDTGIVIDTNSHTFQIQYISANSVKFLIDGNLVANITTNIPASGTTLVPYCWGIQTPGISPAATYTVNGAYTYVECTY